MLRCKKCGSVDFNQTITGPSSAVNIGRILYFSVLPLWMPSIPWMSKAKTTQPGDAACKLVR